MFRTDTESWDYDDYVRYLAAENPLYEVQVDVKDNIHLRAKPFETVSDTYFRLVTPAIDKNPAELVSVTVNGLELVVGEPSSTTVVNGWGGKYIFRGDGVVSFQSNGEATHSMMNVTVGLRPR